jgi:hypothetical protein
VQSVGDSAFANCTALETVEFAGSAPEFGENCFQNVNVSIVHEANDESWNQDALKGTGGSVTLVPVEPERPPVEDPCAEGHSWVDATCEVAKTCSVCGTMEGEALGHTWVEATCEVAKTCSVCNAVEGEALGHDWVEATCDAPKTCSACAATEGGALKHQYENGSCKLCGKADETGLVGDVDGNGKLTYNDALIVLRSSIKLVTLTDAQRALADFDGNGIINYNDALAILRTSIGL